MTTSYNMYVRPDTKVGLRLTAKERKLILKLACLDDEYEAIVQDTPKGKPIPLTLDQWDDFACCIAAKANHTDRKKHQKKLDAIFVVIERILGVYTDDDNAFDGRLASPAGSRPSVTTALGTSPNPNLFSEPHRTATENAPRLCQAEAALAE
jgi:hypothetical protein